MNRLSAVSVLVLLAIGGGAALAADNPPANPPAAANAPAVGTAPAGQAPAGQATDDNRMNGTATIQPTGIPPSQRNPLLADNGDVRLGKLIDTSVYNKDDKEIGSIADVLAGPNGDLQVVISTNDKKVLVPWNKLRFGDAKLNSHNKVLIMDETEADLNKLPTFDYTKPNQTKG